MLRIERAAVEAVDSATSAEDLVDLVQEAMRLEFATIPPYLTAMLSLKPGQNRDIWWAIHDVVVDEMLHLLIGCNLLNALGGRPVLDDPAFVPKYPGSLPLGIGSGLVVGLEKFSLELVERVFMEIEEPEQPLTFPGPPAVAADLPDFSTIGEFYGPSAAPSSSWEIPRWSATLPGRWWRRAGSRPRVCSRSPTLPRPLGRSR